jgi:hypothetical protein
MDAHGPGAAMPELMRSPFHRAPYHNVVGVPGLVFYNDLAMAFVLDDGLCCGLAGKRQGQQRKDGRECK